MGPDRRHGPDDDTARRRANSREPTACYAVYRMADALQATAPIFMRITYGSGNFGTGTPVPAFWVTLGTGSNGAGVITGIFYNGAVEPQLDGQRVVERDVGCATRTARPTSIACTLLMFVRAGCGRLHVLLARAHEGRNRRHE
jgi:hypothetical protein